MDNTSKNKSQAEGTNLSAETDEAQFQGHQKHETPRHRQNMFQLGMALPFAVHFHPCSTAHLLSGSGMAALAGRWLRCGHATVSGAL